MSTTREKIQDDVMELLSELADDWEYEGTITEETKLLGDMGLESLDIVVLATSLQQRYNQDLPFSEFFAEIGQRPTPDVSVREWTDFMVQHLNGFEIQPAAGRTMR
jgi:acyl carrier protein